MSNPDISKSTRTEHDSMGQLEVPANALWGAQTQRALQNFKISSLTMPPAFITALGLIKWASAVANTELGGLDPVLSAAIQRAALEIAEGKHPDQFPLDVFQTGSGTSTNMNVNEVIAHLASSYLGKPVHPNDHVNHSQSSNDVIPTAIHLAAALQLTKHLLPNVDHLIEVISIKAKQIGHVVKTGRTHLMDALPLTLGQEFSGWQTQVEQARDRLAQTQPRLQLLALGGTAIGTGLNAPSQFGARVAELLSQRTALKLAPHPNYFTALATQDTAVEVSGQLRGLAVCLMKIANDLRWMNSGPLAGLGEIALPALQPGSSIMPGKVNPVIPEAVAMVAAHAMGLDLSISIAGQSGNFQLNVMLPLIAFDLLQSIELLGNATRALADLAIAGFIVNEDQLNKALSLNPVLVTALNERIGYDKGAAIAKQAYTQKRPIIDVAVEQTGLPRLELERLLDPRRLTCSEPLEDASQHRE